MEEPESGLTMNQKGKPVTLEIDFSPEVPEDRRKGFLEALKQRLSEEVEQTNQKNLEK